MVYVVAGVSKRCLLERRPLFAPAHILVLFMYSYLRSHTPKTLRTSSSVAEMISEVRPNPDQGRLPRLLTRSSHPSDRQRGVPMSF